MNSQRGNCLFNGFTLARILSVCIHVKEAMGLPYGEPQKITPIFPFFLSFYLGSVCGYHIIVYCSIEGTIHVVNHVVCCF
jgi:hypothetical protein